MRVFKSRRPELWQQGAILCEKSTRIQCKIRGIRELAEGFSGDKRKRDV